MKEKELQNFNFLNTESNNLSPEIGHVLIAEPFLEEKHFSRSVILISDHSEKGTVGIILNKPLSYQLNELVEGFPEFEASVFLGGPVDTNQLFYIHTVGELIPGSVSIGENLYWGGDLTTLCNLIENKLINPAQIRFFSGYAGWSAGQLEEEIEANSWLVGKLPTQDIMTFDKRTWERAIDQMGDSFRHWKTYPPNPNLN